MWDSPAEAAARHLAATATSKVEEAHSSHRSSNSTGQRSGGSSQTPTRAEAESQGATGRSSTILLRGDSRAGSTGDGGYAYVNVVGACGYNEVAMLNCLDGLSVFFADRLSGRRLTSDLL